MSSYSSLYGPKIRSQPNIAGYPLKSLRPVGTTAAGFGAVALITILFLAGPIPRVQDDILVKIPVIGKYWVGKRDIPASDNPF